MPALFVLAGCTGAGGTAPAPTPSLTSASSPVPAPTDVASTITTPLPETATASPTATGSESNPTPVKCGITQRDVGLLTRDWQRVVDSVGRGDHPAYTKPFVKRVRTFAAKGADCPGADDLAQLAKLAYQLNKAADDETATLALIDRFRTLGNTWLEQVGRNPQLLG